MGIFDGFLDKMKLSGYDEDEFEDYDEDEDEVKPVKTARPVKKVEPVRTSSFDDDEDDEDDNVRPVKSIQSKPARQTKPAARPFSRSSSTRVVNMQEKNNPMEVCVIKPTNIEDGREIAETLLTGRAVVLNLEGIDIDVAQRIIDFTSGACFSIDGKLQKITNYIFIATPSSVSISGDLSDLLSGEYSLGTGSIL